MAKLGNPLFEGERLTQAREYHGMTKKSVAQLTGLSENMIGAYERGQSRPRDDVIERLATHLAVPSAFLMRPMADERVERVFWRAMRSDTMRSQSTTRQLVQWVMEAIEHVEEFVEFPEYQSPMEPIADWRKLDEEAIESLAEAVRQVWRLGRQPIPDMTLALENAGVPVLALTIENRKQDGFTWWSNTLHRPIVGVNILDCSWARQRFSLAHELGHVLMHLHAQPSDLGNAATNKQIEGQAHRFASALIFPREAFLREVRLCALEEFATLKRRWGLAVLAQVRRARDLDLITQDRYEELIQQGSRRGYRKPMGEPWDRELPLERPRMLERAIGAAADGGPEVYGDLLEDMTLPLTQLEEAFGRDLRNAPRWNAPSTFEPRLRVIK